MKKEPPTTAQVDAAFEALLEFLKRQSGFDFTGYKPAGLMRRVRKRMAEVGVEEFDAYRDYLEVHPDELAELFNTILINVTDFFRDTEAWKRLAEEFIPRIVRGKRAEEPIRVWSAGCSTGEEPYTLVILLAEALGWERFKEQVKIYATDVDDEALARARQGSYTAAELENVPEQLRNRYFETSGNRYAMRTELRRTVIFGRLDLARDAPISRLDMLVCRNTLMYFTAEAQSRILARLHLALNDSGYLFLGRAEMLLTRSNLFVPADLKARIFTKVPKPNLRERLLLLSQAGGEKQPAETPSSPQPQLLDLALELTPVAQLVIDRKGALVSANQQARGLFRLDERAIGRPFRDLELSYRPVELRSRIEEAYREGRPISLPRVEEWQLRLRPRGAPPVPVALSAVGGEHGERVEEIRWLIRDTSERTRAEERVQQLIREQAAREQAEAAARRSRVLAEASRILSSSVDYRHTLRAMVRFLVPELADAVIVYMLDGEGQLERLAAAHSGPRENASLQQLLTVRTPDLDSTISPVARVIRTGKAELIPEVGPELLGVRGESPESLGILRLIDPRSLMVVPLVSGGAAFGAISLSCSTPGRRYTSDDLGMAEDLASRVTLAVDNARLYAEAERAARARQELLHVVSHDMRNSLNAALLHVELLLSSTPAEERRVRGRSQIETIQRSLNQMHRLVQDLLETEKLEEGQLVLQRERQEIPPLLEEVLGMLQPVAEEEHLHLESHFPEQLPAVLADRGRLLQVFFNLVGNAVKFTPPGGRIMLRAELLGSEVCFSVSDTGPGIAAADLPHVFDPYWQGDQGAYGGRGLGLAIARGIVEGHEGRIWVESRQGVGSTFCFMIPLADAVQ
ncbi:hypothetical protein BH23GEM7_BH23GEM7_25420 [soil metagenome]